MQFSPLVLFSYLFVLLEAFSPITHLIQPIKKKIPHLRFANEEELWHFDAIRRPVIAGNWKLNPSTFPEATDLLKLLSSNFIHHDRMESSEAEIIIFPPFPFILPALDLLQGTGIKVGAQNIGLQNKGAFTGEVSASMIRSMGCDYVMLGHSERRVLYGETNDDINKKVHLSLKEPNLNIILCIGETLEEFENELLDSIVTMQVKKGLSGVKVSDLDRIVIAYEPVWAIGTGKVATPDQAQEAHVVTRKVLRKMFGPEAASTVRIQYGGSVTPESIESLMVMGDVDGALVGGASLSADSFTRVVDGAVRASILAKQQLSPVTKRAREFTAREVVSCKNTLGESPVWSTRDQALYWINAPDKELWKWDLKSAPYRRLFDSVLGCVAIHTDGSNTSNGRIVLAGERAFLSVDMSNDLSDFVSGPIDLAPRPEQSLPTRPNDGRVDRQGRMVFGMYNNYHRSGSSVGDNNAGLYRLNSSGEVEQILDYKYRVSNCICFSPSGDKIYFCDTPTRKLYAFDYPTTTTGGPITNRRLVWTMPASLPGGPDGAQVDAEGFVWVALSGSGRVVRVHPVSGDIDMIVNLPVKCPTSVTFGGQNLDEMFITTRGPDGGGLYSLKMPHGIKGLPEPEFYCPFSRII